jgi:hypothetical protein
MLSMTGIYYGSPKLAGIAMSEQNHEDEGNKDDAPKFGRLLLVLVGAVLLCAALTWLMATVFPDFPNFS